MDHWDDTKYRLASCDMVHAPGMVRFLKELYRTSPITAVKIVVAGWDIPENAANTLLAGRARQEYTDGNGTVGFTHCATNGG